MITNAYIIRVKTFYQLTKPGIIYGNAIVASAGFMFATKGKFLPALFLYMLAGISLVIASACVYNNILDRNLDKHMARTKNRALVTGTISTYSAVIYATLLGVLGIFILNNFTNTLTTLLALFGMFAYVVIYGIAKRTTIWSTVVGSISGAIPPLVGYAAVTNQLNLESFLLFMVLVLWQMPHFYAIAIFRMKEYAKASISVLPIKKGIYATKIQIVLYIFAFSASAFSLSALGYTGISYLLVMTVVCYIWLAQALKGFETKDANDDKWARKVFGFSLVALLAFSLMISINFWIP